MHLFLLDALRAAQILMCFGLVSLLAGILAYVWWIMRPMRHIKAVLYVNLAYPGTVAYIL